MPPAIGEFRKSVQQDGERPVRGSGGDGVQFDAVDRDTHTLGRHTVAPSSRVRSHIRRTRGVVSEILSLAAQPRPPRAGKETGVAEASLGSTLYTGSIPSVPAGLS